MVGSEELGEIEILFNNATLERFGISGTLYQYTKHVSVLNIDTQNTLTIRVKTKNNTTKEEQLILFK